MSRIIAFAVAIILVGSGLVGLRPLGNGKVIADTPSMLADTRVSPSGDLDPHDEPSIAISPVDNRIMVATSKVIVGGAADPIRSVSRVAYYNSSDAGATWAGGALLTLETPQTTYQLASDPTIAADTDGNFYLSVLMGSGSSSGKFDNGLYVFKSTDGGHSFSQPVPVFFDINNPTSPKLVDKPYIAIDTSPSSPYKNTIYVAWVGNYVSDGAIPQAIRVAHKRPSDTTFSDQQKISHPGGLEGPALATGPNGEVYGVWEGHGDPDTMWFNASLDGGITFFTAIGTPPGANADLKIHNFVLGTLDGAMPPTSIPGVRRINSFPTIDVDRSSGPNRGKLYVAWAESTNAINSDILLITLAPPNGTPPPSLPIASPVKRSGSDQFFPYLRVDPQTGTIYVAFYDQFGGGGASINPFLTSSTDGGATFAIPSSLSSASSNPQVQSEIVSANKEGIGIGDYIWFDISKNKLGVVWTDARNAKQEIFFGGLSFGSGGGGPTPPPNDNCSTPHVIGSTPFSDTLDTTLATASPSDPATCSGSQGTNSVWYSIEAASNTVIGVDTSGSNYDTVLSVFTGGCGSLSQVACNDDFGNNLGNRSMLTFQGQVGAVYLIEVTGKSAGGTLGLRLGYPTVTSIQYTAGPDGNQSLQISGAGFIANNAQVIVQVDGADNLLPNTFFTGQVQGDGTVSALFANRRKLKKLIKPGVPVQVRVESPIGSGITSVPLSFTR